ncbi:uncharacterized protein LOC131254341 [Magnolia sinica]|uniref:uncharacterized protein LOC131254341 n=1 Tax=Magnolia sinica TaxID=86752 RepID=UPI00265B1D13|nr:uncharacterized protein LOC131254341 [Magnolia sinica]
MAGNLKLNVDGSALSKPGPAGGGCICRDSNGNLVFAFAEGYGSSSNNRAELRALHDGLELCISCGLLCVSIESDSKWVVDCINGRSSFAWKWKYWFSRIQKLSLKGSFRCSLIPREANGPANGLAKLGSSTQADSLVLQVSSLPRLLRGSFVPGPASILIPVNFWHINEMNLFL